jgi:methionyl-tRNA formyltransferase
MSYVFLGTSEFSKIVLENLINAGFPPNCLVCNPDRPVGRKKIIVPPPVKRLIIDRNLSIKIFQPENKKGLIEISDDIFSDVDFGIIAAYTMIIPDEVIKKAKAGIIGVHPSLLPKYRGPSPIQCSILNGEKNTGVTLYFIDELVDHGPILAQGGFDSVGKSYLELEYSLAELGAKLLIDLMPKLEKGDFKKTPQDESIATYTNKISTDDGYVDSDDLEIAKSGNGPEKAEVILRKVLALNPEPGVYTIINNNRTKILGAEIKNNKLVIKKIQIAGKKPIDVYRAS